VLRIAVATTDGEHVDEHFGRTLRFDVYDLDADRADLVEVRSLQPADEHDARAPSRLDAVRDCTIVHVTAIGPSAAAQVTNAGIMPLKTPEGAAVGDVVGRLQGVLAGTPPPWLRKVLQRDDAPRRSPS
jgi:nitrogen fixation protein NifX